jgi:ABC-type xylose transport system permease subunit
MSRYTIVEREPVRLHLGITAVTFILAAVAAYTLGSIDLTVGQLVGLVVFIAAVCVTCAEVLRQWVFSAATVETAGIGADTNDAKETS